MGGPTEKWLDRCSVDGDGSGSGGCNLAQVTPSTELQECAIRKWEELMTWVATVASIVVSSMASMVAWVASSGGVDGFDGVEWWQLGSSTQRALTWKSLCVTSSEFGTHRGSLLSV